MLLTYIMRITEQLYNSNSVFISSVLKFADSHSEAVCCYCALIDHFNWSLKLIAWIIVSAFKPKLQHPIRVMRPCTSEIYSHN